MLSESLEIKERDFFELNKELEEKVQSLMVEVDSIISRQEDVIHNQKQSTVILSRKNKAKMKEIQSMMEPSGDGSDLTSESPFLDKYVSNETVKKSIYDEFEIDNDDEDECVETKKKHSTNDLIIRFLKSQIIKLHTDIKSVQYDIKKKNEQCKDLELEIKRHDEKREKLQSQISLHKDTIVKSEATNFELESKIQAQNLEISSLKKEIEGLKKDLKSVYQQSSNNELRLNRSLEENEKIRSSLKISQNEERDLRDQVRKIQEEKRLALRNSEKQRTEIFQAFKKQIQLVDNLKKQKVYLEASKQIQFIEEDFTKLLEWKSSV